MPKKKNKKVSKAKSKEIKGQLGKKKETAREKMIGQSIGYRSNQFKSSHPIASIYFLRNGVILE